MKKKFVFLLSFLGFSISLNAQKHVCGTQDPNDIAKHNPNFFQEMIDNLNFLPTEPQQKTNNNNSTYVIPVVVHVVHNNGPEKISVEQIKSQFPSLFYDFRRVPGTPGFGGYGVDTKIEFSLATVDPNGNPTDGVVYVQSSTLTDHDQATEESALKTLSKWDPTKYLNIWLVKSITTGSPGTVLGYATFPNFATSTTDGLVIRADCFGNYNFYPQGTYFSLSERFGRTPTHEIGHWLSLFHTFQGSCGNANCSSSGDQCCDTPPTKENNFGAPKRQNTCGNDNPDKLDDPRFYMDYVDNSFMNKFSRCQTNRMISTLNNISYTRRVNLWKDTNQQATGTGKYQKPRANFWSNTQNTVVGAPVTFIDYSMGQPNNYTWTFTSGTTTFNASGSIVDVTFPDTGWYNVSLVVENLADTASITKNNFIYVGAVSPSVLPFTENFEANNFPPIGWSIVNKDISPEGYSGVTWGRTNLNGSGGFGNSRRAARMIFSGYSDFGQEDELWSPVYNTQNFNDFLKLEFSVAYVPFDYQAPTGEISLQVNDTLTVWVSTNAGNTWTRVYYKGGDDLATDAPSNQQLNFYTATQWRRETIDLTSFANTDKLRIKFMTINGFGQSLSLDDIYIYDKTTQNTPVIITDSDFNVVPNPNHGSASLNVKVNQSTDFQASIYDVQGKLVYQFHPQLLPAGNHTLPFNLDVPNGIYFVNAMVGNQFITRKLIKN